ncbi:Autotransporter beta-domain protein [Devosia sp. LC5]|uniref:Ig-like domain repeat protein n=1 Tax=Devosia sp. LC5 TaxID=1502724 RepID=UPI0004E30444|nr:Ig-like domain repeat protein [Devosia sp. LC5]KFC61709.1 Autotransporter beta-domain protein [Devosia sp. LC5]
MLVDHIRRPAPPRSLKNAGLVLILAALVLIQGVSQAAAAVSNGSLIWSYVGDDLCVAGPYKNSDVAVVHTSFSATTGGPGETVSVSIWTSGYNRNQLTATTPAGSTIASASGDVTVRSAYLVGNATYLYLRSSFIDAGDGRGDYTPPLSPPDAPAGNGGNYHQTAVDMSQDPDCIPRPDVQLEYSGAVSSGAATVLNGRDFGDVQVDAGSVAHTFTLRSIGISSVNVSAITVTAGSGFSVSPASLGAISATGDFTVSFDPSSGGIVTAQLDIVSDAVSGPISVPLAGNGLADTTAPAAPVITAPANGAIIHDSTPTISGTAEANATVTLTIDGVPAGNATAAGGAWAFASALLADGPHRVTATATDAASNVSPASAETVFTVGQVSTTVSLAASVPTSTLGQAVLFTATLSGGVAPTGSVEFFDGATSLGSVPLSGVEASLSLSTLGVGPHSITAVYSGDTDNASSTSGIVAHSVDQIVTTLTLAASGPTSTAGESVSFTATVVGAAAPTGSVEFFDGPTSLGSVPLSGVEALLTLSTLGVGPHAISATYSGDINNAPSTGAIAHSVGQIVTTATLAVSSPSSTPGQAVTFTATVLPATASGTVTFLIDGTAQPPSAMSGGVATLTTSLLDAGSHEILARYDGDTRHAGSMTPTLAHTVIALGSVTIRQETDGMDAVFGFSSATSGLNLSVATSGGRGASAAISLAAGTYSVTGDDMSGAGFGLTGLACSDGDSIADIASRTASIVLDAGEALICTFTSVQSGEKTSRLIEDFLITRADLILANQPDVQRRIDRLNGATPSGGNPVSALMNYLPGVVQGGPLTVSTSLGAIERLAGNEASGQFDMWLEGTFALFDAGGPDGTFNTASFGADYLVTPDLLIGGFVQVDHLSQSSSLDPATISGTGWLAGPYATARLNESLYLDILAAAGTSSNLVSPYGTYEDGFDATRWLLSASLQGQWQWANWTFSPRARVSYFEETTKAYTDSLGVGIASITAGLGQIAVGPAISYRYAAAGNVVIDTGLRLEAIADILRTPTASGFGDIHARIEGTIDLSLPGGAKLGLSSALDGIGGDTGTVTSAKIKVRLPF